MILDVYNEITINVTVGEGNYSWYDEEVNHCLHHQSSSITSHWNGCADLRFALLSNQRPHNVADALLAGVEFVARWRTECHVHVSGALVLRTIYLLWAELV